MPQSHIPEQTALACVDVLISEERPNVTDPLGNLCVESRRVQARGTVLECMPNQEALVEELNAMPDIHHVAVHDGLPDADRGAKLEIADFVMVDGSAYLQPWNCVRMSEKA